MGGGGGGKGYAGVRSDYSYVCLWLGGGGLGGLGG